ncbi:flippase [Limosilactobacillus viscerum]|uniref:flippase n=1 Tax=Limosilactobacillus viscerum TaxID=2993450 RepID=UPI0024BB7BDE|nr:flippase [Limosilactobacillus viscerum]
MQFLKKLLSNSVVKNGIWMYMLQFFNMIIPLMTLPYVTRILGTEQYGVFSSAFNIVGYLQVVVEYGFSMSASREVALDKSKENLDNIFSEIVIVRGILFLGCIIGLLLFIGFYNMSKLQICSYFLLAISLLGIIFQVDWLFQGLQDMKYIAITNVIARTLSTILIFLFVKNNDGVLLYCLFYASSPIISNIIGLIIIKTKYDIKFVKVHFNNLLREIKKGWYIFTTQFTSRVFGSVGTTFLVFFSTSSTVGIFSAIQKIPNVVLMLWLPISQIIYPVVSKKINKSMEQGLKFVLNLRKKLLIFFGVIISLMIPLSKTIVLMAFGNEYVSSYYWLIPLLLWSFVSIDNGLLGVQILLGSGHDKQYSRCFLISVIVTIISNGYFIYLWGGFGASLAPLLSESVLDVLLLKEVKKLMRKSYE